MKKRILIIITLILVVFIILGSLYFISYNSESKAKLEYKNEVSTIPENISNEINDGNKDEVKNSTIEENSNIEIPKETEEKQEVTEKKQETKAQENQTKTSTQSKNKPSNNNSQKTESVKQTTTQPNTQTTKPSNNENSKPEEKKTEPVIERCTNNSNHGMGVGNSGKWFNSKNEAIAYYDSQTKLWGDKWENFEIDDNTYYKNCPSGYEVWDCMYCGKWTINFYYR